MYYFKEVEKAMVLQGRTISFVARKIGITPAFLTSILNRKRGCSKVVAYSVTKCLCQESEIEDYFIKEEE